MEKIIFLGTSAGMPTKERNVSSFAIVFKRKGDFWLFDCGEGTQQQIIHAGLKLSRLKKIFITHLHGDHVFGLPGLLATRGLQGIKEGIEIYGPVGLEKFLLECFELTLTHIPYSYQIHLIEKSGFNSKKLLFKTDHLSVFSASLNHHIESFGFLVIQEKRKKTILAQKLKTLGVMPGPLYQSIKEKENGQFVLRDGMIINSREFIIENIESKKICYCSDTSFSENAVSLAKNVDWLIHEATFSCSESKEAKRSFHSTIEDAVQVARIANAKNLILTHISPRYHDSLKNPVNWEQFRQEAESLIPGGIIARDLLEIKL